MPLLAPPPLKRLLMTPHNNVNRTHSPQVQYVAHATNHPPQSSLIQNGILFVRDSFNEKSEILKQVYIDVHTIVVEDLTGEEANNCKKLLLVLNLATHVKTITTITIRNSPCLLFYPFFALSYKLSHLERLELHDMQFNLQSNLILPYIDYACPQLKHLSLGISMAPSHQFPIDLINGASISDKLGMLVTCTHPTIMLSNLVSLSITDCRWISSKLLFSIADCFPQLKELRFSRCSMSPAETLVGSQDARDTGVHSLSIMKLDVLELSLSLYNLKDLHALALLPPLKLILNGSALINDAGTRTLTQLLYTPLKNNLRFNGIGCEAQAKKALEELNNKHSLLLTDQ